MLAEPIRAPDEFGDWLRRAYRTRKSRARVITDEILKRLPHYHSLPDSMYAEIYQNVLDHLDLFYRVTLRTGRSLVPEDLEKSRQLARLRASQDEPPRTPQSNGDPGQIARGPQRRVSPRSSAAAPPDRSAAGTPTAGA